MDKVKDELVDDRKRKKGLYEPLVDGVDRLLRMTLHTLEDLEHRMLEVEARLGIERTCADEGNTTTTTDEITPPEAPEGP